MTLLAPDELLHRILTSRVYDVVEESPLDPAPQLSARLGRPVLLKREDLLPIFSFKLRGAYNAVAQLPAEVRARGVIAASAGNHAQGVAFAARALGCQALIVMPRTTPDIKVSAVRRLGAEVILEGDSFAEAQAHADALAHARGLTFIHPFDDWDVIAGQGTIGAELLRQSHGRLGAIFVPVGGGGLLAGIGAYVKKLLPQIQIYGVEPIDADTMYQALHAGEPVRLDHVGLFVDGVAVRQAGERTFAVCRDTCDGILRVDNDAICAAVKDVFDDTRSVPEPAGALAVAGLKAWAAAHPAHTEPLVAIVSGANLNFDRLRFIAERAEIGEAREALLGVTIPERPGAFRAFCAALGRRVITEFNYRLASRDLAHIFVGIRIAARPEAAELLQLLDRHGYPAVDLTDDEMAKLHVRYMVGGRSADVQNERLVRFEFPERPGALLDFLDTLGGRWNISLFHYRNHGADYGRVLAGFEVPAAELLHFHQFLQATGYEHAMERDNPAYRLFLSRE